ncbi:MAG: GGDEF domain-containing protein [Sulfurimonas sp.]
MLLSQLKEREFRFRLALRMVFPLFLLFVAVMLHIVYSKNDVESLHFFIEITLFLVTSVYFILYLIYKGFEVNIIDPISKAFTREYMYGYMEEEFAKNKEHTLVFINIDNLRKINSQYGVKSADRVILEVVNLLSEYFKTKGVAHLPIGHISGSNLLILLDGEKQNYKSVVEFLILKLQEVRIDDIETNILVVMNDTKFSRNINYLIDNLFELQIKNKKSKTTNEVVLDEDPTEYEYSVINSLKREDFVLYVQNVYENDGVAFKECSVKLRAEDGKILHQKNYVKVLNKLRLMDEYDLIVIKKAIKLVVEDSSLNIAISISPTTLRNVSIFSKIMELLNKHNLEKGRIIFVLNEFDYFPRIDRFNYVLEQLRDAGIMIAINRVGAIHTSFLYLRDLSIDIIRIDSFYTKEKNYDKFLNIVDGFSVMAHKKGLKVWSKLIENEKIYNSLKEIGVDYLQGKFLSGNEEIS